jgi:uncharacterized pyridoxamine 5'-phosphate oxidase family protein
MEQEIDQNIIKGAGQCHNAFCCLSAATRKVCKIRLCMEDKLYFVDKAADKKCRYIKESGKAYICSCPARKELYRKWGI